MVKIETCVQDNQRIYSSTIQGSLADVLYDSALIIRGIYDALDRKNHGDAEMFRMFVARCVNLDGFWTVDNTSGDTVFMDLSDVKKGGGK